MPCLEQLVAVLPGTISYVSVFSVAGFHANEHGWLLARHWSGLKGKPVF